VFSFCGGVCKICFNLLKGHRVLMLDSSCEYWDQFITLLLAFLHPTPVPIKSFTNFFHTSQDDYFNFCRNTYANSPYFLHIYKDNHENACISIFSQTAPVRQTCRRECSSAFINPTEGIHEKSTDLLYHVVDSIILFELH